MAETETKLKFGRLQVLTVLYIIRMKIYLIQKVKVISFQFLTSIFINCLFCMYECMCRLGEIHIEICFASVYMGYTNSLEKSRTSLFRNAQNLVNTEIIN